MTSCRAKNCEKESVEGGEYCERHTQQLKEHGYILDEYAYEQKCKVKGCDRNVRSNGFCSMHYARNRRKKKSRPTLKKVITRKKKGEQKYCGVEECKRKYYARGYCKTHYIQVLLHGKITNPVIHEHLKVCTVENCNNKHHAKGYCSRHYLQMYKHGKIIN